MRYDQVSISYTRSFLDQDPLIVLAVSHRSENKDWSPGANCSAIIISKNNDSPIAIAAISRGGGSPQHHSERAVFRQGIEQAARNGWLGDNVQTGVSFEKNFSFHGTDEQFIDFFRDPIKSLEISLFSERSCCDSCEKLFNDNALNGEKHAFLYAIPYNMGKNSRALKAELDCIKQELATNEETPVSTRDSPPHKISKSVVSSVDASSGKSTEQGDLGQRFSSVQQDAESLAQSSSDNLDRHAKDAILPSLATQSKKYAQTKFHGPEEFKTFQQENPGITYADFKRFNDYKKKINQDISYSRFKEISSSDKDATSLRPGQ